MMPVLRVETRAVDQVDSATDDVTGRERRPVRLPGSRRAERVPVVAVVTVRLLVPA